MSDLRHAVAEALYRAFWVKPPVPTDVAVLMAATKNIDSDAPIDQAWLAMADECIRQMEWARKQTFEDWTNTASFTRYLETFPTTLAPEDWKP